jgi:SAM-dependent methyltransferase
VNYWDTAAQDFDSLYEPGHRVRFLLNRWFRRGLFQRAEITAKLIRDMGSPTVMDVGCGSGRNIPTFFQAGARHVTGIDSSTGMLELAAKLVKQTNNADKTELLNADFLGTKLDLHADIVVAMGVFDYLHEEALPFLTRMVEYADKAVAFTAPGHSLIREPLRARRYKRKGVSVHFFGRKELEDLCSNAGLPRFEAKWISSSGYFVTAWKK